jgi:hypothetical protein
VKLRYFLTKKENIGDRPMIFFVQIFTTCKLQEQIGLLKEREAEIRAVAFPMPWREDDVIAICDKPLSPDSFKLQGDLSETRLFSASLWAESVQSVTWLGDQDSIPGKSRVISRLHCVQAGSGFCWLSSIRKEPEGKAAKQWQRTVTNCWRLLWVPCYHHNSYTPSWLGAWTQRC